MASAEIYNKALDLLSRREHSRKELYLKLTKRFESKEDINFNLDRLEEKNLLSDSRFAEEYVQARRKKGFGPIKISAELEKRGVNGRSFLMRLISLTTGKIWLNYLLKKDSQMG